MIEFWEKSLRQQATVTEDSETELLNKMGLPENWKNITRYQLK